MLARVSASCFGAVTLLHFFYAELTMVLTFF